MFSLWKTAIVTLPLLSPLILSLRKCEYYAAWHPSKINISFRKTVFSVFVLFSVLFSTFFILLFISVLLVFIMTLERTHTNRKSVTVTGLVWIWYSTDLQLNCFTHTLLMAWRWLRKLTGTTEWLLFFAAMVVADMSSHWHMGCKWSFENMIVAFLGSARKIRHKPYIWLTSFDLFFYPTLAVLFVHRNAR